jgi:hypothetical protein
MFNYGVKYYQWQTTKKFKNCTVRYNSYSIICMQQLMQNQFKGTVARDFRPSVFSIPYTSLINRLKPFCIWHRIRRDNRFESRQNRCQRCHWHRWNSAKKNSVVDVPMKFFTLPSSWFQWCQWHCWNSNIIDFLGEYEAICETDLGLESGP